METSGSSSASVNNNYEEKHIDIENMQIDTPSEGCPPRAASPMITVSEPGGQNPSSPPETLQTTESVLLTPTRERKKSPSTSAQPRQRKRSQTVRGELLHDPDKLLSYKHHDKKSEEPMQDPTFPGGLPKPPPEPRAAGTPAERKRSNVTFCPVIETVIDK